MPPNKSGRPRAPTCELADQLGRSCPRAARVKITVRVRNAVSSGYSELEVLRCWKHYVELENAARAVSHMDVVESKVLGE